MRTVKQIKISESFLLSGKDIYLKNIHPFDFEKSQMELYKRLVSLGKNIIEEKGLQHFLGYLMESQYSINLWAAYIGLEFGRPVKDEILKINGEKSILDFCLSLIENNIEYDSTEKQKTNAHIWVKKIKTHYNTI